ncbi:MAG: hypothetical protein ACP5HX_11005 [Thermoproteota archaeon]
MPRKIQILHMDFDNVAADAPSTQALTATDHYVLKKLLIGRKDGSPLTGTTAEVSIAKEPLTIKAVMASTFGSSILNSLDLNEDWPSGQDLKVTLVNKEGATVSFYADAVVEVVRA